MKRLAIALLITAIIFLVELIGGFLSNSLALLSDAGHMLTDAMALLLALAAMYFASRPATSEKTYGFYRLEILSALFNGSFLILVALYIFYEAYQRFISPSEIRSVLMLSVAGIGLVANLVSAVVLHHGSKENLNVRGAFLHVISDAVSSLGVIVGGVIIYFTGWLLVDSLLGVLIGLLILRGAASLVSESVNILLQATPKGIDLKDVVADMKKVQGVKAIHDVHLWTITTGVNTITAHIVIEDPMIDQAARILGEVRERLGKKYQIKHFTFQTECESCPEGIICEIEPGKHEEHGHKH